MRKYITAGLVVRRAIRRFLLEEEIDFFEEKGWIDSVFYLNCSNDKYNMIIQSINTWKNNIEK